MTSKPLKRAVVWLRRDLRTQDNPALSKACEQAESVVAVYVITPTQWQQQAKSAIQIDFIRRRLVELRDELSLLNIALVVLRADDFSQQGNCLLACINSWRVQAVFANKEFEVDEVARDHRFTQQAKSLAVDCCWLQDRCIIEPGRILNGSNKPYKVFTPFSRSWLRLLADVGWECLPRPSVSTVDSAEWAQLALLDAQWHASLNPTCWPAAAGLSLEYPVKTTDILHQLRSFASERAELYRQQRDFPAIEGTSRLSPHLAIGSLSARQCLARLCYQHGSPWELAKGPKTWLNELIWREFYHHVMVAWPHVCRHQAFNASYQGIVWPNDKRLFQHWCEGTTGFPLVDAAMRQLNQTGWMHNRLRMIVASFLVKDLLIDWRWGEQYFMSKLIDGELPANNGGWQWAASTGTDAAPYFRIFNPETQSKRFDESGQFIRRYIPELADCPTAMLHKAGAGGHYLAPVVDHKERRAMSLELYSRHHHQHAQAS